MRPPSYYTSLANSATPSHNYSYNSTAGRNSTSQQLRTSFSSPSSSTYVTRTHLPFVPQSMLVAHCFTGVGSSTKPYGQSNYVPRSSSSSSSSNYSSSYTRPRSTKRYTTGSNPYLSTTNSSSSSIYTPRSNYLSASNSRPPPTASTYRSNASSYYKPIKLRERPLLTQISRQINSTSPTTRVHSAPKETTDTDTETTTSGKADITTVDTNCIVQIKKEEEDEENWSSDVARNISRNKYLIKFREFDKRPSIPIQLTNQVTTNTVESTENQQEENIQPLVNQSGIEPVEEYIMKLPREIKVTPEPVDRLDGEKLQEECAECEIGSDKKQALEISTKEDCDISSKLTISAEKKKAPKEKRNIKLKIKAVNTNDVNDISAPGSTKPVKKTSPGTGEYSPVATVVKPTKLKRLVMPKTSKTNKTITDNETAHKDGKTNKTDKKSTNLDAAVDPSIVTPQTLPDCRKILSPKLENQSSEVKPEASKLNVMELSKPANASQDKRIRFRQYNYDDFNFLSVLGHGGWGFVILAELKEHDACFAVKCIKKITIVEDDDFDSIMIERKVLALGNVHPFICKLFCTFETDGYLFFVMEYCAGGDLMFHVQKEGKFTESRCRFYAAEIICAIRFLHNRHIIYRDLKLDNILLDSRGHIRLVDFGMCQCRTYREEMLPSNFCGTPEYISPEIIKGVPYNHSVDWWSFGVLLYEMAVGKMPFRGNDENELLWNVCYEQIHYPMFLTKELTSLLQLLLEREPTKRMGMSTCKAGDIYDQPWFKGVDWPATEEMRVQPPFVPEVNSKRDVQNFDADFTQSTPELSPVDASTLSKIDQNQFQKFPYTNPNIFIFD